MQRERMGQTGFYTLAFVVSGLLAPLLIVVAGRFHPLPQEQSALYGLGLFVFTMIYDLCILCYVWSRRSERESGVTAWWRAGLAAGSLLISFTAGLLLRSLGPLLWEAFLMSWPIAWSAYLLVSHRLDMKTPELEATMSKDSSRWFYILNGLVILLASFSLSLDMLPESSRAVLGAMVLAFSATAPQMIYGRFLQQPLPGAPA